ncbi:uncharacterized protein LOC117172612 isoform X1 [Belonocnema kinseyi]|uniref:uncharacterized protein LOC117172612 isoform X1 n=1 Tax=Belonocnema kinseyi TaxID=2817044 RepID=UPI00143D4E1F|nr:uncharacterized protein LOC117172612 isoform X1 [Belonocnema kinseyi]
MGKSCIVCKSCSDKRPELIFHGFPKDEELRKTWIENMGITKEISKFSAICSIHFTEECFKSTIISKRPVLIKGSIPTILTEEELMQQESMQDESTSDSMNSNGETQNFHSENMPQQSSSQFKSTIKTENTNIAEEGSNYQILDEFSPPRELQSDSETEKMIEELQYSCRKIRVKGLKWQDFRRLPEILQEMHWTEAQHLIEEQTREIRLLQRKNRRCTQKIENLTLFTKSMKREIAKRARNYKMESPS